MYSDLNNLDKENEGLQDDWLTQNLNITQLDPPHYFTQKVMEQIEIKPNPLNGSPIFWILVAIPGVILLWLALYTLGSMNISYLNFIPKVSDLISIYALSKYVIMFMVGGLFFIGIDYFISKQLSRKQSYSNFLLI